MRFTSHGWTDASGLSRLALMRRYAAESDPITLDGVQEMIMPLAYRGPNGSIRPPFYDALALAQWFEHHATMPETREPAATALRRLVAVNWAHGPAPPHPQYNWKNSCIFLRGLRERYPVRPPLPIAEPRAHPAAPDMLVTQRQKYINFRTDMVAWAQNFQRPGMPEWIISYWVFHPYDPRTDHLWGIPDPFPGEVRPNLENADVMRHFRLNTALRLDDDLVEHELLPGLIRDYWMVHHISLEQDDDRTIEQYFEKMQVSFDRHAYPQFFQDLFESQRDELQILRDYRGNANESLNEAYARLIGPDI